MKNNSKLFLIFGGIIVLIFIFAFSLMPKSDLRTDLEPFAKCLADKGAKFYGTFWCPHCQNQKKMFGTAKDALPYIECSTPDGNGQLQVCTDAKVESYPTWEFSDGSRMTGEIPLETLAEKTTCVLPNVNNGGTN